MALRFDHDQKDTIAAIATGMSEAGIGIVRISGPSAGDILQKLFRTKSGKIKKDWAPNTIHFGSIIDPESGETLDEVLVSWMKAPHSYTTEDTAEINTHGGMYLLQRVLDAVLRAGARTAEPGEFTKRAFLGGRMDLSEAEAVMDLIHSQNEFSRKVSLNQLQGKASGAIREKRSQLIYEIAFIESALDDPENYSLDDYPDHLKKVCSSIHNELQEILIRSEEGSILQNGIQTVIVGKPNAGKSSLLNVLAGEDRAIVTPIAGTTRDVLHESVRLGDVILQLTDTAGIHDTEDIVEQIGVDRAKKALESAQLILFVLDSSVGITDEDREIAGLICEELKDGKHCIVLCNKADLPAADGMEEAKKLFSVSESDSMSPEWGNKQLEAENGQSNQVRVMSVSLLNENKNANSGENENRSARDQLKNVIQEMFRLGQIMDSNEVFLTAAFQKEALRESIHSLELVEESIENGMSEDFFSIDLRNAYSSLGKILGEEVEDDLVEEIFSKFCLGK